MSIQSCISRIKEVAGGNLSDDDVENIMSHIRERADANRALGMADPEARAAAVKEASIADAIARRNTLLDQKAKVELRSRVAASPNAVDGFTNEVHALNRVKAGSRYSAEAEAKARSTMLVGGLTSDLERAGLFKTARDGTLEKEWTRELFEISKGDDGEPGISGSKEALQIAQIVAKHQDIARKTLNDNGAAIGDLSGYITRTAHDADKIREAGYAKWKAAIMPVLDQERTFGAVKDQDKFLQNVYANLRTGLHMTTDHEANATGFVGPGNLAKRISENRVLHFKDAEGWLAYQKQFGEGNVLQSVVRQLDGSARDAALLSRFGTNPRATIEAEMKRETIRLRDSGDHDGAEKLAAAHDVIMRKFGYLDGTSNRPVNRLWAQRMAGVRAIVSLSRLGGVTLTHTGSLGTKAAELRYHGVGLLEGYSDALQSIARGRGAGETKEIMDLLHAGMEGLQTHLLARYQPDDNLPGKLATLTNQFFKVNGLTYLVNAQKAGAQMVMARYLGKMLDTQHGALNAQAKRLLEIYRISPEDWEKVRGVADHAEADGRKFLTPDAAMRIEGMGEKAKEDLALRIHAMYHDIADRSIITPGIAEKSWMLQGTRPGTLLGEALRFVAQFKQWPAAAIRQGFGRDWFGNDKADIQGMLHLIVASTIGGYVAATAKDIAAGREPGDPRSPATMMRALAQGGGLGIAGDFMLGDFNRANRSVSETIAGPVLGELAGALMDIKTRAIEGKDILPELFKTVTDNVPFSNLFYTKAALDYFVLWQMQEWLSPGWARRYQQRIQSQQGRTMWLSPARAVSR